MGDTGVEILLSGSENHIKNFLNEMYEKKPPLAQIFEVKTKFKTDKKEYCDFTIKESNKNTKYSGSVIPPDVAICDKCLSELKDGNDFRYNYFFITCTDCGPRYTIIKKVPFDRGNTTMKNFFMCTFCKSEYANPLNRRFHAQTIACQKCGPRTFLTTKKGEFIDCNNPIREAGKLLSEGAIVAIKGYGGYHISTSTIKDLPIKRLRNIKHRKQKPFAIMARDKEIVDTFAEMSRKEEELLTSHMRPIVLLDKSKRYYLSEFIAPGLHNIGVMLPYTGLHYLLFKAVKDPAFVLTSGNPPNQPIIKDDADAKKMLGDIVDYFLFYNRKIVQRCDDSVVRIHGKNQVFIRRSRGYSPAPLILKKKVNYCVLGLGGEMNNTACILSENKAFLSQHIGNLGTVETNKFLENTIKHLIYLTKSKIDTVACDIHPNFSTTRLAKELAREHGWKLSKVQHHYAHVAALMAEKNLDEIIGICCDGYGYGLDGEAWGGEILFCHTKQFGFERLGHLQKQVLIGGDLSTKYPLRVAAGILHKKVDLEQFLMEKKEQFPNKEEEIQLLLFQLEKKTGLTKSSSCGRILDAASAILDLCYERTYQGEPAIKLESVANKGKDVLKLEPLIENNTLNTTHIILEILKNKGKISKPDLAFSTHSYIAKGLASIAIDKAFEIGIKTIGFSGGVACNKILVSKIKSIVEHSGLKFVVHRSVPPGDGGLSLGQAYATAFCTA
jgi:hydrogenase maturation protein HypF